MSRRLELFGAPIQTIPRLSVKIEGHPCTDPSAIHLSKSSRHNWFQSIVETRNLSRPTAQLMTTQKMTQANSFIPHLNGNSMITQSPGLKAPGENPNAIPQWQSCSIGAKHSTRVYSTAVQLPDLWEPPPDVLWVIRKSSSRATRPISEKRVKKRTSVERPAERKLLVHS